MKFVKHRCNTRQEIKDLQMDWGAEIDLRSDRTQPGKLHLSHDPWTQGEDFREWIQDYSRSGVKGPLILNTKEDGLEELILSILKEANVNHFFFLDTALPTLVKRSVLRGEKYFAVRYSEFEPIEQAFKFKEACRWAWVDCFGGRLPDAGDLQRLRASFSLCFVSPELQGCDLEKIREFKHLVQENDSVCTKRPDLWI